MRLALLTIFALAASHALAQPGQPPSPIQQAVQRAMASDIRTPEERARDRERQPVQKLEFFRLRPDMRVIEILPFSGWFTKIIAPVLEDVEEIPWGAEFTGGTPFFASGRWDVERVDLVLTFRNYHNFAPAARMAVNKSAFDALKPGGLYGIVDHTRRHMEPDSSENGRRVDPVLVIKEVQEAGFRLVDYSTALRRPDDELRYEVGRQSVTGNSDRFALLFMRPER